MSFNSDVYPFRNNRDRFVKALMKNINQWTHVNTLRRPTLIRRCKYVGFWRTRVCSYKPQHLDIVRVKALLDAWTRRISDRYLDFQKVVEFSRKTVKNQGSFEKTMKLNAPTGAVMFARDELEKAGFINDRFLRNSEMSYNFYFSYLLAWDEAHVYGLIPLLTAKRRTVGQSGNTSWLHPAFNLATNWIYYQVKQRVNGVYRRYNIRLPGSLYGSNKIE